MQAIVERSDPIFSHDGFPGSLEELYRFYFSESAIQEYLVSLVFSIILPIGFVHFFVDTDGFSLMLNLAITVILGAAFVYGLVYYFLKYRTMRMPYLAAYSILILLVFLISMKGCVESFSSMSIGFY